MSLTVSSSNPRYFQDSSGKPVYLTGSHNWDSLQDRGPNDFDYTGYVNWMEDNNYNFMRLWAGEVRAPQLCLLIPFLSLVATALKGLLLTVSQSLTSVNSIKITLIVFGTESLRQDSMAYTL